MKILALFAHPDDEAFGPGGTLAKLASKHDVVVLTVTNGQAGKDSRREKKGKLGNERVLELKRSARVLGVKRVIALGFKDGTLSNNIYHALARKIDRVARRLRPVIFLTGEPRGGSGHLDHVAVSLVSSFVFRDSPSVKVILYYCISEERARANKKYFIYVPPGYKKSDVDLVVPTGTVWEKKLRAMQEHKSQAHDMKRILKQTRRFPKEEYFLVEAKKDKKGWIRRLRRELA